MSRAIFFDDDEVIFKLRLDAMTVRAAYIIRFINLFHSLLFPLNIIHLAKLLPNNTHISSKYVHVIGRSASECTSTLTLSAE
jgi:hypothetical protein